MLLKVLFVLALVVAAYWIGRFTGFVRGQAASIVFYENTMKELAKQVLKEYEDEEGELL